MMFNHAPIRTAAIRTALPWGAFPLALLLGCSSSLRPVAPGTKIGEHSASQSVLALPTPCEMSASDGVAMGRPDGTQGQLLPPGNYVPSFEDPDGVFFASPSGARVTEPLPLGVRDRAGGIYVSNHPKEGAWVYLGDSDRVTERQRLPERCHYSIEPAPAPAKPG
jgi:hypothetical protein